MRGLLAYVGIALASAVVTAGLTLTLVGLPIGVQGGLEEMLTVGGARALPVAIWILASFGGCVLRAMRDRAPPPGA